MVYQRFIKLSFLEEKSDHNILSAEFLIDQGLHSSSIHCSYYAVFQLMKHLYVSSINQSFEKLDEYHKKNSCNVHKVILDSFCNLIDNEIDRRNLRNGIIDLKNIRNISDYKNMKIDIDISKKAFSNSKSIISKLKKTTLKK